MRTHKRAPGQNYQGVIGYRIALGRLDSLRCLFGAPLLLGVRLITPIPVPGIRTDATILVSGKPTRNSRMEVVDIPPGGANAPESG